VEKLKPLILEHLLNNPSFCAGDGVALYIIGRV
jgi:hypothetical protein